MGDPRKPRPSGLMQAEGKWRCKVDAEWRVEGSIDFAFAGSEGSAGDRSQVVRVGVVGPAGEVEGGDDGGVVNI